MSGSMAGPPTGRLGGVAGAGSGGMPGTSTAQGQQQQQQQQQQRQPKPAAPIPPPPPPEKPKRQGTSILTRYAKSKTDSRIDPHQIPRPKFKQMTEEYSTRDINDLPIMPPPATARYSTRDTGNSNPRQMRFTIHGVPEDENLLDQSRLILGAVITPFAELHSSEEAVPVVDHGDGSNLQVRNKREVGGRVCVWCVMCVCVVRDMWGNGV